VDVRSASSAPSGEPPRYVASVVQSGTSASAPLVAGAVALYLGRYPAATPDDVARALVANSTRAPAALARYTPDRFLYTTFVDDDTSADGAAPTANVDAPLADATVTGPAVDVTATAADDVGVTRVELFAGGRFIASDDAAPYAFTWDTRREPNGPATLVVRAYDRAGHATDSAPVTVTVANLGVAHLDAALGVPRCETVSPACDSVDLLRGRADLGPEANAPNTLEFACPTTTAPDARCRCADGPFGAYGVDESVEQVAVSTLDGGDLAVGANVQVDVDVVVGSMFYDVLDLYSSATATEPTWRYLASLQPLASGPQRLSARFTLPAGATQAIRAALRYGGSASICTEGGFDERDDLAFVVAAGTPDTAPPTGVVVTAPSAGAKVSGPLTLAASAGDDHLVSRVEFLVGPTLVGTATAPPFAVTWNSGTVPNGTYAVKATAYDGAGNSTASVPVSFQVKDETAPAVTITSPADGKTLDATPVTVKATAIDAGVVARVELWVDGGFYAADPSAPYELPFAAGTGTYVLVARAYDGAGNFGDSAPVTVHVGDTVPPTCVIKPLTDAQLSETETAAGTLLLEADAQDDKGVASVQFFVAGKPEPLGTATAAPYSSPWETGRLLNGTYTLFCVARDASGNASAAGASPLTVTVEDKADPTVVIVSPSTATQVSGVVVLEASAGDDGAVERVEFYLDAGPVPIVTLSAPPYVATWNSGSVTNGAHTLTAKAYDYNGHSKVSDAVAIVTTDATPPSVALVFPLPGATLAGTVPVRAQVADPGGAVVKVELLDGGTLVAAMSEVAPGRFEVAWATADAAPGAHTVAVRATDGNGNERTAAVQVRVAPGGAAFSSTYGAPACLATASVCHSSALLDGRGRLGPEPGTPNTLLNAGGGRCADGAADGVYHEDESIDFLAVQSVSGAPLMSGAEAEIEVRAWVFDPAQDRVDLLYASSAAAPVWRWLASPHLQATPGEQTLSARYTLPYGDLQAIRARIVYGAPGLASSACIPDDYADHDDLVFAVASAPDASPPAIELLEPLDGASVGGAVKIAATATDDVAIARVELLVDGDVFDADFAAPYEWTWDTAALPPGAHVLAARAIDFAGKTTDSAPVTVTVVDQLAPTVMLTAPLAVESVMGTVALAAEAADAVGVTKVEFWVGGQRVATDTASPWAATWSSGSRQDGVVTVTAKAYDAAGNARESDPVAILVSNVGNARWENGLKVPRCAAAADKCFSGALVNGRGPLGPEPNAPNTLGGACADGGQGSFHVDESIDAITVRSEAGTLTAGGAARVEVKVWAGQAAQMDHLDLYATGDATAPAPVWVRIATLQPAHAGAQVLWTTYTLPSGAGSSGTHAVRAQLRYAGDAAIVCGGGTFDDRDDLVFAVTP
jgi:large repetitive protein